MNSLDFGNIAIIGDAGKGKTTLCNTILGWGAGRVGSTEYAGGVTNQLTKHTGTWRQSLTNITIYDMPGFGDENIPIRTIVNEWRTQFQSKKFTAIFFVVQATDHRFTSFEQAAVEVLRACVETEKPWDNVIFVGTHADKVDEANEGSVKQRLENLRKRANLNLKEEKGIWRQVGISLKKDNEKGKRFYESGLRELENHLKDLQGKHIEIKRQIPDDNELARIYCDKTYSKSCFNGDMIVKVMKEGKVKESKLTEVKLFDMIQVNDGSFETVMILSRHMNQPTLTLDFQVEDEKNGRRLNLCLVPSHFMYVMQGKQVVHIPARKVTINDKLLHFSEDCTVIPLKIISIKARMSKDTVNVRTKSRTAIVNDFCCSSVVEGDAGTPGHNIALVCGKIHKKLPNQVTKIAGLLQSAYYGIKNL